MATKKTTTTSKHSEQDIHRQAKGADWIQVKGARTHNLKNISVDLPRGVMTVLESHHLHSTLFLQKASVATSNLFRHMHDNF
jgi:excinuclease UvrABC ATPase subunit